MGGEPGHAPLLLLTGLLVAAALFIKWALRRSPVPALVGFLALGFLVRTAAEASGLLSDQLMENVRFLADIGVVVLLFRVGLESHFQGLLGQLRNAPGLWLGNVLLSGVLGYFAARSLLGYSLLTSLYVAVALTATSVAIPVAIWRESRKLRSENGQLLLDTAELDDVSAILLMSLLFAVRPLLQSGELERIWSVIASTGALLMLKLVLFATLCYAYAQFAEHRVTRFVERFRPRADPMLMLVATGFIIASVAGLFGFSVALGAFFAGLIYSRDPEAVLVNKPFVVLYELFTPFFFIAIGFRIDPQLVMAAWGPGLVLLTAAIVGKLGGTVLAGAARVGWMASVLLGISMIPRAEIAMIVIGHGQAAGEEVIPSSVYAAMVLVSVATCTLTPLILRPLLRRDDQSADESAS